MTGGRLTNVLTRDHPSGEIRIPLIELRGMRDGPTLTLTAGCHGAEYAGIEAASRLGRELDPTGLSGTLRIVPVANVPGYLARREAVCPIDETNLNRVFPGDPQAAYTVALADFIFTRVVRGSDFLIDMHGGDIFEALVPYVGVTPCPDPAIYDKSMELGRAYGLPYILSASRAPMPGAQQGGATLATAARNSGIPAILTEVGGEGLLQPEHADLHIQGVKNVMHMLGMIQDPPVPPSRPTREMKTDFWRIQHEGMVYPTLKLDQHVRSGDPIGIVRDWFGNKVEELTAPEEAWVIAIVTTLAARPGAIIYQVAFE